MDKSTTSSDRPLSTRFQVLFHSPFGVLFTFPSRYYFTIGSQACLALGGGPPCFRLGFSCQDVLRITSRSFMFHFGYRAFTFSGRPSQVHFSYGTTTTLLNMSYNPICIHIWFGPFPFRSPLLRKSHLLSSTRGTEMFHFPRLPLIQPTHFGI
uniref:Uncharacterized protein n=1 Tax=Daphnia magna TaxID=35525 RepID=A0A0P6BA76_9CRUS